MRIEKIINNNIISAIDEKGVELVVMGKGLGFGKRPGSEVEEEKIEKVFKLENVDDTEKFKEILASFPIEYIRISNEIISYAKEALERKLNQNVYLTLTDHIRFAVERHREGMIFSNALYEEIKLFYPKEYMVGKHALYLIENQMKCRLTDDEAASIALHIVNAETDSEISTTFLMTKMMHEVMEIIEDNIDVEGQPAYPRDRLITSVKHLAYRLISQAPIQGKEDQGLYHLVKELYTREYMLIEKVSRYIEKAYQLSMTEEEKIYMTLDVKRMHDLYTS